MAAEQIEAQTRPKKWLTPVILVVLREESSYGYEIMERLTQKFGFEQISPATVYRTLRQMEKEGLCCSEWETPEGSPANLLYYPPPPGKHFSNPGSWGVSGTDWWWTRSPEPIRPVGCRPELPTSTS